MKVKHRFFMLLCSLFLALVNLTHPKTALSIEFGYPSVNGSVEYISSGDVDETNPQARLAITSALVSAALPVSLTDNSNLEVNLRGGFFNFDWTDTDRLKFSNGEEPWGNLYSAEFSLSYVYKWNTSWSSFLGSGIGAGWEEDTDDMFSYRGFLGTTYRWASVNIFIKNLKFKVKTEKRWRQSRFMIRSVVFFQ
jgi:hypothetical protein